MDVVSKTFKNKKKNKIMTGIMNFVQFCLDKILPRINRFILPGIRPRLTKYIMLQIRFYFVFHWHAIGWVLLNPVLAFLTTEITGFISRY